MMRGQDIAKAALALIGTPFQHGGRLPRVALDCVGVVMAAHAACGIPLQDPITYGAAARDVTSDLAHDFEQVPIERADVGDVLAIYWGDAPKHLGIVVERRADGAMSIVHARGSIGRVCRHRNLYHTHSAWRVRRGDAR